MANQEISDRQNKFACCLFSFFNFFLDALYPPICIKCKKLLKNNDKYDKNDFFSYNLKSYLCYNCSNEFVPSEGPMCSVCGMNFKSKETIDHICYECIIKPKKFYKARSCGSYTNVLRDVIHHYKYKKKQYLAVPLGKIIYFTFEKYWSKDEIDIVIPVPLHIKRFRQRGFNQAYLLLDEFKKNSFVINRNVLKRIRWTEPQTNLKKKMRLINLKNAFALDNCEQIKNKNVLIVDDVYTTGSTINECAKTLIKGGANRVSAITIAKT